MILLGLIRFVLIFLSVWIVMRILFTLFRTAKSSGLLERHLFLRKQVVKVEAIDPKEFNKNKRNVENKLKLLNGDNDGRN